MKSQKVTTSAGSVTNTYTVPGTFGSSFEALNFGTMGLESTSPTQATKIWVGTTAQYDAITLKDASTLYFILP